MNTETFFVTGSNAYNILEDYWIMNSFGISPNINVIMGITLMVKPIK